MARSEYVQVTCSIEGCPYLAIVMIGINGIKGPQWWACSSECARELILDIKRIHPQTRGIWTKGVNHDDYVNR